MNEKRKTKYETHRSLSAHLFRYYLLFYLKIKNLTKKYIKYLPNFCKGIWMKISSFNKYFCGNDNENMENLSHLTEFKNIFDVNAFST